MKASLSPALVVSACLFAASGLLHCADSLPAPVFFLKGDAVENGVVALSVPSNGKGEIRGTVSSDGEALVFDGTGGEVAFGFDAESLFGNPFTISVYVEVRALKGSDILTSGESG